MLLVLEARGISVSKRCARPGACYYPRVYDTFLERIAKAGEDGAKLVCGQIEQSVILQAHDEASKSFLQHVRQALQHLVPIVNKSLDRLLSALNGERTPFTTKELSVHLRVTQKLKKTDVDDTLEAMKGIGIFEVHPRLPSSWRVGRLFESALMIYNRSR